MIRLSLLVAGILLLAGAPVAADVTVVTTDSMVRLPHGSGSVKVIYRNTSELTWFNARITVESAQPVQVGIKPQSIPRCQPADRCVFAIHLQSTPDTPNKRFPLTIRLTSDNRPRLHVMSLSADSTAEAGESEKGWMHAGSIRVGRQSPGTRVLVLVLLSAVPVVLLLGLGLYFKKRASRG